MKGRRLTAGGFLLGLFFAGCAVGVGVVLVGVVALWGML